RVDRIECPTENPLNIISLVEDAEGRIWIASLHGGLLLAPTPRSLQARPFPKDDPVRGPMFLVPRWRGGGWAGTGHGIVEVDPSGGIVRTITVQQGLNQDGAQPLLLDRDRDLWVTMPERGIERIAMAGLSSFERPDGVEQPRIASILRSRSGQLVAIGSGDVV